MINWLTDNILDLVAVVVVVVLTMYVMVAVLSMVL